MVVNAQLCICPTPKFEAGAKFELAAAAVVYGTIPGRT
jgi:hypothetical protein